MEDVTASASLMKESGAAHERIQAERKPLVKAVWIWAKTVQQFSVGNDGNRND
jgi:hypothetical protein